MFMGIGNLTELTEADSTGINALLLGICRVEGPLRVDHGGNWLAKGAVKESMLAGGYRQRKGAEFCQRVLMRV